MKFKNILFLSLLIFLSAAKLFSQKTVTDTVPYKIATYEVKKQQKVIELAEKLKVDPEIILKLNNLRSVQRDLVTGLRIKIPVYPKGYKYEPATVVINEVKAQLKPAEPDSSVKSEIKTKIKPAEPKQAIKSEVKKGVKTEEQNLDSIAKAADKQLQNERRNNLEMAKEKARQDSARADHERITNLKAGEDARKNYNPEIDENNLMLVDAILELNEAMLAGVKASLDTLSKPDPEIKDKNDVKEILQRMKRARDRKELIPYLEYMNDSLSLDCSRLRMQRVDILSRLTPYHEHERLRDSLAAATLNPVAVVKNPVTAKDKKPVKKNEMKTEVNVKDNAKPKLDTVIVYDVGKKTEMKPAKEKNMKPDVLTAKNDTIYKPVSESVVQKQIIEHKKGTWDTARAIIDSSSVVKKQPEQKKVSEPVKKTSESSKHDSIAAKFERDVMQQKVKADTVKKAETKLVVQKKDTVITKDAKLPETLSNERKTQPVNAAANADTIQNIKSQFLLKRAQKALAEKKLKPAEEYLNKAIELWNDNYEAWMTLADYDAQYGSPAKALKEYQECARIDSSKPKLFYSIASLHLKSKKKTEAVQYFSKTVTIDTGYIPAYMGRASVYSDWKQYDAAIRDYDKVLQINKSYHFAYKARGMVKQLNKRFSEAVDDFTRYLIFEETDPSAYYYRGLAKIGNNELLDGCFDLSKSAEMGYEAAEKAIKKSCE